jgi:hypothetical protein
MAKISLGKRPKSFKRVIKVPMVEGGFAAVEVAFIYRTRTEFGQFVDGVMKAAQVVPASASDDDIEFSLRDALERTRDTNADYILQIVEGWDLDEPFSRAAVVQLCDELPGAAQAIISEYRAAITEGRLGN